MPPRRRRYAQPAAPADTASLYVRLSREAAETNLSKDGMLEDVRALAARLGLAVVGEHVDDGYSGAVRNRPEFVAWLDDARHGRASTLIAWHVDRMTREGVNVAALILDAIEGKDPTTGKVVREPVRLLDTKGLDSASDDAAFRFRFVIAAEVARAERERMRDRARAAQRRARAAGRYPGGPTPYGFRAVDNPDGPGRVLAPVPEEVDVLHGVVARLREGMSFTSAVRWANANSTPRRAREWSRTTLRQTLQTDAATSMIFSPAERLTIARALAPHYSRPGRPGGVHRSTRLLGGVLLCYSCGSRLAVGNNGKGLPVYRCATRSHGRTCTGSLSVAAEPAEEALTALWLDGWGLLPEVVPVRGDDTAADRMAEVYREIDEAGADVVHTRGAERVAALERLEALEARRDALEAEPPSTLTVLHETGRTYADAWHAGDLEARRALLLRTVGTIVVSRGKRGRAPLNLDRFSDLWRFDPAEVDRRHRV